ncbi:protein inscuteable homolog isoform X1 [Eurytemora carolleeae]|uniref:protein inscuteable homolog isoform X1 n=1 Tax=Eurytemora carolleeae TaxID=1294199 RepID=UPI000C78787C|nr:protein inscuteable homolog isoform X1 [Eurytemora carolleeae]|eukprot:XP_023343346.1 protein inscuteable homolog isoform X1 [Eurytemora affinis]
MQLEGTAEYILQILNNIQVSLFTRDQLVTILANMSGLPESRSNIVGTGGLKTMIKQLNIEINQKTEFSGSELGAITRILKKSAIGLSRGFNGFLLLEIVSKCSIGYGQSLCCSPVECEEAVSMGAVERLVQLCECPASRNYSDSVLVAALAALRKMASFITLDVSESFVGSSLVDSFNELSRIHESYV